MATITSANSVLMLGAIGLYPTPRQIQGFAADDMFATDAVQMAETVMGADGNLSAGFVFAPTTMNVVIMPDSPSLDFFSNIITATQTGREVFRLFGTVFLPAIGYRFTLENGVLSTAQIMPPVKRTLQQTPYTITWQRVVPELV